MEEQDKLNKEIGTEEIEKLQPEKVKIENVEVKTVGEGKKQAEKVVCHCKHSGQDDLIRISSVKYEKGKELKRTGLWYKEDKEGKIQRGSALALFMNFVDVKTIKELIGKEIMTTEDDQNYLVFKAY